MDIFHDTYEKVVHGTPWQEDHDVVIPLPHPYHVYAFGAVSNCGVLWEGEQSPATFRAYVKITGWVKDGLAVEHISENSLEADGITEVTFTCHTELNTPAPSTGVTFEGAFVLNVFGITQDMVKAPGPAGGTTGGDFGSASGPRARRIRRRSKRKATRTGRKQ